MIDREPTLGEIAEDLRDLMRSVDRLTETVERTYVRLDVYRAEQTGIVERVRRMEDRLTWVGRAAVTGLLLPILVAVILALILTGGGS